MLLIIEKASLFFTVMRGLIQHPGGRLQAAGYGIVDLRIAMEIAL